MLPIFHFIKEIFKICFVLLKITSWLSILCTNDNIFAFFIISMASDSDLNKPDLV